MRHWKIIGAIISLLAEGALQVSGFTSLPLAIVLAVVAIVLLGWSAWPLGKRIISNISRLQLTFKPVPGYADVATRFSVVAPEITPKDRELLDSYNKQADYDKYHLKDKMLVKNGKLTKHQFDRFSGGIIELEFQVFNGSVLGQVMVGYAVDGELIINGHSLVQNKPEICSPPSIINGVWNMITIKQIIPATMVNEIFDLAKLVEGVNLNIDYGKVKIYADEEGGKRDKYSQNIIELSSLVTSSTSIKYNIKRDNTIADADFYDWTFIPRQESDKEDSQP